MTMIKLTEDQKSQIAQILKHSYDYQIKGKHNQYYSAWTAILAALNVVGADYYTDSSKTPVENAVTWIIANKSLFNGVNEMTTETTEQTVEEMMKAAKKNPMKVWINSAGQFLVVSESTTHTGKHVNGYFTDDLNQAYVAYTLPKFNDHTTKPEGLIAVPAWAERKVTIGIKPDGVN